MANSHTQAPDVATDIRNLIQSQRRAERAANYAEAERLYKELITIQEDAKSHTDPLALATSYNNLGELLLIRTEDRLDEVEKWLKRALEIREEADPLSVDAAVSRENLAQLHEKRGELDAAKELRISHPNAIACGFYHCAGFTFGINELKACGKCKAVLYCSQNCQTQDWKQRHKQFCKKPTD